MNLICETCHVEMTCQQSGVTVGIHNANDDPSALYALYRADRYACPNGHTVLSTAREPFSEDWQEGFADAASKPGVVRVGVR